ncbi:MAG: phage major capsid protein [Robiginitomaculum sp.]|nr:MAG: phage major capsid protein [Robiginitomaculum sp.]
MMSAGMFSSGMISVRADAKEEVLALQGEIKNVNQAFAEFKDTQDERVKAAAKGAVDTLTTEKLDTLDKFMSDSQASIDGLNETIAGLRIGGGSDDDNEISAEQTEYNADFKTWALTGDPIVEAKLRAAEKSGKIYAVGRTNTDEDGGYTAPVEWDRTITDGYVEIAEMRGYSTVKPVKGQGYSKFYNIKGTTSGWVGEEDDRDETNTSKLKPYAFSFGEIYAKPKATQRILEDSEIDFAAWIAGEVSEEFSVQEGTATVSGNGVNKPRGVLTYDAATEAALVENLRHPLGAIQEVNTGAAAALSADGIVSLTYGLPEGRMAGAEFFMNRKTVGLIRLMKDGDGNYLWRPSYEAGEPAQLLGFGQRGLSNMPDVAANTIPILFGNMKRTYTIFDRVGVTMLRDPYSSKPYVEFYTRKRVGGGMMNPEWMLYHRVKA